MKKRKKDFSSDPYTPQTQGIKYAGSKLKLLPSIIKIVKNLDDVQSVLDGFSGTTRVSQALAQLGYKVTANDVSIWSEVFATCFLKSGKKDIYYQEIIDHLNNLDGYNGWYSKHYGGKDDDLKKPFQIKNTEKLDAIRDEIESLNLDWPDKCVVLTSLILALDAVDSTMGHYVSYLSKWSARSHKDIELKLPKRFKITSENSVFRDDIFNTIKDRSFDLAYFDPPYGSNNEKMPPSRVRYASYYHIWTSIILHDKPKVFGKACRREDSRDLIAGSIFEEFRTNEKGDFIAMEALKKLISKTNSSYILLSYSSGGRATKEQLMDTISESGKLINAIEIDYKANVMSQMTWTKKWLREESSKHQEYLFLMKK